MKKHWLAPTKKISAPDGSRLIREYIGKTQRRSFYCDHCQVLSKSYITNLMVHYLYSQNKCLIMNEEKKDVSVNHQDHPRREGQSQNTTPIDPEDGQRSSNNHNQPMTNMMNESEEQKAGNAHEQKDEEWVKRDQRQP
jgi:hypothetical protein